MRTTTRFKALLAFCLLIAAQVFSQQVNTLYFMDVNPYRNKLNPAFQPISNFYLGFPVLGYSNVGLGNNTFTLSDIYNPDGSYKDVKPILKATNQLRTDIDLNLLSFGFRTGKSYWNFTVNQRAAFSLTAPKSLVDAIDNGTTDKAYSGFDFTMFTEAGLGYSRKFTDRFTAGLKLKMLIGQANLAMENTSFYLKETANKLDVSTTGFLRTSSPLKVNGFNPPGVPAVGDMIFPNGMGAAADLGFTYEAIKNLNLSAALTDFGMIKWNRNLKTYNYTIAATQLPANNTGRDSVVDYPTRFYTIDSTENAYTTGLSPKLNVGVEYSFWKNRLSAGLLSRNTFFRNTVFSELTGSLNLKPSDWFNLAASYSILNGRMSNVGVGLGLRTGILNWFVSADYIPLRFTTLPDALKNDFITRVPSQTKYMNVAFGVSFVFGNRKDGDKDGVVDKRDKCPETPYSVVVDKKGCPLDTDGDGVPDYLDKCPGTPPEAYDRIDQNGCPTDFDGDGVADYLDKCPDTPAEARGFVDKNGCTLDTDGDGVFDYLDKCPDTPAGVKVDSKGCPLDTDGDGVADYLDKCPDTPAEARSKVDASGCPLDTDSDGVPDYKDKCPDTPAAARATVDANGCPKDTDGDGVADYLDKCPDTPAAARSTVDANGCPLDSDGDGVLDYLDRCPKVPGVASNQGCPEVKKEVKRLFQKALQGIQFETAKYTIKPVSFKILNDVAAALIANPTYIVEIQGHTDNVGKPAANMILSDNRAKAVMKYLVDKGVPAARMTAKGYGDTLPVATNKTTAGKALNRRVEFVVTFEETSLE